MIFSPTAAEEGDYARLHAWVSRQPAGKAGIRLCCPRGHLIAHVGLFVSDEAPRGPMLMQPAFAKATGLRFEHKSGFVSDGVSPEGFLKVRLICRHRRCAYSGSHLYDRLALEVARHAERGNPELRLTA